MSNTDQKKNISLPEKKSEVKDERTVVHQPNDRNTGRYVPIKAKVMLFFGALIIFLALLMIVYLQYFVRASFRDEVMSNLHVAKEKNVGVYAAFIDGLKTHALDWSSDNYIKELTQAIVDPDTPALRRQVAVENFGEYLRERKMKYDPEVLIVDLLDQNGVVVASSRDERIGVDERQEEIEYQVHYFSKAIVASFGETFVRSVVFEEDETTEPMFHVTVRMFRTELDEAGNAVPLPSVLLLHFTSLPRFAGFLSNPHREITRTDESEEYATIRNFETMETYVVNKDGIVVTPTRGIPDVQTKRLITTAPVEECLKNSKEVAKEYLDYRGVSVIGVSACVASDGIVIVNEMESREAYAILDNLIRTTMVGAGAVFLLVILLIFLATQRLLGNLEQVTFAARWFALGVFDERAPVTTQDEIGQLAVTFNIMLDKIEASKKELTANLEKTGEQNKFLEKTKIATMNVLEDAIEIKSKFESQRNELQSIIASVNEGILLVDKEYVITLANPMAGRILGLSLRELIGKKAHDVVGILKEDKLVPPGERPIARVLTTSEPVFAGLGDGYSFKLLSGKEFPVAFFVGPLTGNQGNGAVAVFRDITQEKSLDEAKSSFISIASHQLRTPLTSIRWYSEMLMSEDTGPLTNTQRDFVKEVNDGALRLYQTIDLLLAISRIESGRQKGDVSEIDLNQFTQEVAKEIDPQLKQKQLSLALNYDPSGLPKVKLDPMLLRQVVLNLISNSIRYTNNDGHIGVEISANDKEVRYAVRDDGIGVPEAEKSKLFQKFFRAENARIKVPDGSGLGIALVKDIVESWGGTISFETEEGKGSLFCFTIPLGGGNFPGDFFG